MTEQNWISVKDRLPIKEENGDRVLVASLMPDGTYYIGTAFVLGKKLLFGRDTIQITHWMDLKEIPAPSPPKV